MNNTIILNILCEGQTEERFVQKVLRPYLKNYDIATKCRLLGERGGMINYIKTKNDLTKFIKEQQRSNKACKQYFSTMFDLYALPNDFPDKETTDKIKDKYDRVKGIEQAFYDDIIKDYPINFIPYIQLHEIEALLFCDLDKLADEFPKSKKEIEKLKNVLCKHNNNPELINDGTQTAPSKRVEKAIEKEYRYNKWMTIENVTTAIGIDLLRERCKHFNDWISRIINN